MKAKFDAITALEAALKKHQIQLEVLVAETAIWAHPNVHARLVAKGSAARHPDTRRKTGKETRGKQDIGNIRLDDNTAANNAIKWAIGVSRKSIVGYETCHIWPKTCYDARYHTAVANLVLLPRALAGLTDHLPHIQRMLQYRAYELYKWFPEECGAPVRPKSYIGGWRDPEPDIFKIKKRSQRTIKNKETKFLGDALSITLIPKCPLDFHKALLIRREAEIEILYADGSNEKRTWCADKISNSSNVLGNLRSRAEFRQGEWQKRGIKEIRVRIK